MMTSKFRTPPRWSGTKRGYTVKNATLQVPTLPTEGRPAVGSTPQAITRQGVRRRRWIEHQVHLNSHIIDADQLRALSGKQTAAAVRNWANGQGIRTLEGKDGPWTTTRQVDRAMGDDPSNDPHYSPEDIA